MRRPAKKTFQDMGYKPNDLAGFENHYNPRLNKCFVQVTHTDASNPKMIWTHRTVLDAFEGKVYGEYHWHTDPVKKYWEVPPFQCKVVPLAGEASIPASEKFSNCKSEDEFNELIE